MSSYMISTTDSQPHTCANIFFYKISPESLSLIIAQQSVFLSGYISAVSFGLSYLLDFIFIPIDGWSLLFLILEMNNRRMSCDYLVRL